MSKDQERADIAYKVVEHLEVLDEQNRLWAGIGDLSKARDMAEDWDRDHHRLDTMRESGIDTKDREALSSAEWEARPLWFKEIELLVRDEEQLKAKTLKPFYSGPPEVKDLVTVEDVLEVATRAERQEYTKLAPEQKEGFLDAIAADYYKHSDAATKEWEQKQMDKTPGERFDEKFMIDAKAAAAGERWTFGPEEAPWPAIPRDETYKESISPQQGPQPKPAQQLPLAAPDPHSREVYRALLAQQPPVVTRSKKHGLEPGQSRGMGR
jgi:hypothetical protein